MSSNFKKSIAPKIPEQNYMYTIKSQPKINNKKKKIFPLKMKRISKTKSRFLKKVQPKLPVSDSEYSSFSDSESDLQPSHPDKSLLLQLKSPNPKDQESATSLLMNVSCEISSKELSFLFSDPILEILLEFLSKTPSLQLVINTLSTLLSLGQAEAGISEKTPFERSGFLIKQGLFERLDSLMGNTMKGLSENSLLSDGNMKGSLREILRKTAKLLSFYAESLETELVEKEMMSLSMKFVDIALFLDDEAVFLDVLDLFHILTEVSGNFRKILCENQEFLLRICQVFKAKASNPGSPGVCVAKAYIIGIFLNLSMENAEIFIGFQQEIIEFLEFLLSTPFLREIAKFLEPLVSKKPHNNTNINNENPEKINEEINEKPLENQESLKKTMDLFVEFARALELSMVFLHNLFENDEEFEDLSDEEEELDLTNEKKAENKDTVTKNDAFKENLRKLLLNYKFRGYFIKLITENLLLIKSELSNYTNSETLGLENLISSVAEVNYLAISVLSVVFSSENSLENQEKCEFLGFLWTKLLEFGTIAKEIAGLPEFLDIFLLIFKTFHDFLQKNKDILLKSGVMTSVLIPSQLFEFGKILLSLEIEEISSIFFEILALRYPIILTNSQILPKAEVIQIVELLRHGFQDKKAMVTAEALNALFDIFADESYNWCLKGMLEVINEIKFDLGSLGKRNKKFIKETERNLKEFIKYKRNLGV